MSTNFDYMLLGVTMMAIIHTGALGGLWFWYEVRERMFKRLVRQTETPEPDQAAKRLYTAREEGLRAAAFRRGYDWGYECGMQAAKNDTTRVLR